MDGWASSGTVIFDLWEVSVKNKSEMDSKGVSK